jgi:thiol-disulfide isomerase/thioredoxin
MLLLLRRLFAVFGLFAAGTALALSLAGQNFSQTEFDSLQKAGKPTLVMVHADWCPVCRAQDPVVSDLLQMSAYKGITTLVVDFDSQRDALKFFRVSKQSTLIVFKGGKEMGRSTGDTNKESIEALLKKAV